MSTADIGLSPDPMNPLNDLSTMNKTMEYMAFELPVVAFDLRRPGSRRPTPPCTSSRPATPTRTSGTTPRRSSTSSTTRPSGRDMGKLGRARVEEELAWPHQERAYLGVYAAGRAPADAARRS